MESEPNIEAVFHTARELPAGPARENYLDQACGGWAKQRERVESLLRAHGAAGSDFLQSTSSDKAVDRQPQTERSPPRSIGPYRILDAIGHGAQATVYLAEHESLRRRVALKVLHNSILGASSTARQRFRREAEVTANLEDSGICSVYETGDSDGLTWIAMQFVAGRTLAAHLAEAATSRDATATLHLPEASTGVDVGTSRSGSAGRSDMMRVVAFIERAARSLHAAHERGLVHRDIKPGNLMVADDGRPVLLDFGIAHASDHADDEGGLTRTTDVLGTPHYMSPEQLRATAKIDRRADVYALGVTLFECLTRKRPFEAPSREALYRQILTTEPPAPRTLNPQIPRDLEVVLLMALDKAPDRRYRTALDFSNDLRRVQQFEPIAARPITQLGRMLRWARRSPIVAASLLFALVSLVAGLGASLSFLRESELALDRELNAQADWYDGLSREVAGQDMRGDFTTLQAQLQARAIAMIDSDVPGFRARIEVIQANYAGWNYEYGKVQRQNAEALEEALDQLDRSAGICASDWFHHQARNYMAWPLETELRGVAVHLAELSLEQLEDIEPNDLRVVRARMLLLDALSDDGQFAQVKKLSTQFLNSNAGSSAIPDDAHIALYESRLGLALLQDGKIDAATEVLERSWKVIHFEYPNTWLAFGAQANLITLYETQSEPTLAAKHRADLSRSLSRVTNSFITPLTQWLGYSVRIAIGPHRTELWDWLSESSRSRDPVGDRIRPRLEKLLEAIDDDDPVLGLLYWSLTNAGMTLAKQDGWSHPTTREFFRAGVDLVAKDEAAKSSEMYATALVWLAGTHLIRDDVETAKSLLTDARDRCVAGSRMRLFVGGLFARCLIKLGEYKEAEQLLGKRLASDLPWLGPTHGNTHESMTGLVILYRAWGKLEQATRVHRRQLELWDREVFRAWFAWTLLSFHRLDEAQTQVERTLATAPRQALALRCRALIALLRDDPAQAAEFAELGIAAGANICRRTLARARLAMRDAAGSIVEFESATLAYPSVAGTGFWRDYGLALVAVGQHDKACRILRELTERLPRRPDAWAECAEFLCTAQGLPPAEAEQALYCARQAHQLGGEHNARRLALVAEAQFKTGASDAAADTMTEVLELMNGRDAQWLRLEDAKERLDGYKNYQPVK